jgi:hypothetical protein
LLHGRAPGAAPRASITTICTSTRFAGGSGGDGEAIGTARIAGRSDGRKAEDFTIYGRIPDRQPVRSGYSSDAVEVSVAR